MTRLLHQFLHNLDELIDRLVFSGADVIRHAGPHMASHQLFIEAVERGGHCRHLGQDVRAVRVILDHALDPADLSLCAAKALQQSLLLLIRAEFLSIAAMRAFLLCHNLFPFRDQFIVVKDRFIFCFTVCFCVLFAPGLALWFVFYNANLYTPRGYISYAISIYPPGVCVNNIKRTPEKIVIAGLLLGK